MRRVFAVVVDAWASARREFLLRHRFRRCAWQAHDFSKFRSLPPRCLRKAACNDRFEAQMEVTALPGLARGIVSNRGSNGRDRATTRCAGEHAMASKVRLEI